MFDFINLLSPFILIFIILYAIKLLIGFCKECGESIIKDMDEGNFYYPFIKNTIEKTSKLDSKFTFKNNNVEENEKKSSWLSIKSMIINAFKTRNEPECVSANKIRVRKKVK